MKQSLAQSDEEEEEELEDFGTQVALIHRPGCNLGPDLLLSVCPQDGAVAQNNYL